MTQLLYFLCFCAYVISIYISGLLGSLFAVGCFFPRRSSHEKAQIWLRTSPQVEAQIRFVSCIGAIPIAIFSLTFNGGILCAVVLGSLSGLLLTRHYGSKVRI